MKSFKLQDMEVLFLDGIYKELIIFTCTEHISGEGGVVENPNAGYIGRFKEQ